MAADGRFDRETILADRDDLIEQALRDAAREALQLHREKNLTIPVWRDGKTVWVPPEEIEIPEEPDFETGRIARRR